MELNKFIQGRHGNFVFNASDAFIGRSLTEYGEWAEDEIQLLQRFIRAGDLVVDIGANIGTHTVCFSELVGAAGQVIAFEPQRLVYQCLCANLALNNIANVWALELGVADRNTTMFLPSVDYSKESNFGGISLSNESVGDAVSVTFLDQYNLPSCALIKVDVEGMEIPCLKGAENTIKQHGPILYVENNKADSSDELISYIESLNYNVYWHFSPFYNPNNFFENKNNVFGSNIYDSNIICSTEPLDVQGFDLIPADSDARIPENAFDKFQKKRGALE